MASSSHPFRTWLSQLSAVSVGAIRCIIPCYTRFPANRRYWCHTKNAFGFVRGGDMSLHWRIALAVLCLAKPPAPAWVDVVPKDGGCAIQMPAMPKEDPKNPGRFSVENDSSSWILRYEPLDPPVRDLVASGNRGRV